MRTPAPLTPTIVVIDDDLFALQRAADALDHRFGGDYTVLRAASADAGERLLRALVDDEREVALVAAALRLSGGGTALLDLARGLVPGAVRVLLIDMGDATAQQPVMLAAARGQADTWILHGWESPEEWFYPQVQQALSEWNLAHRQRHEHVRVVGPQWSPRSHALRDLLTRNMIPFGFYDAATDSGKALMAEHGLQPTDLPALVLFDGQTVAQPTDLQLSEFLGVRTRASSSRYDLVILGAGPAGLAAAVYAASEGLSTLVVEPSAIGGQAGSSSMIRNYPGFPRGIVGGKLTYQFFEQATLLGAEFVFSTAATGIAARGLDRVVTLSNGDRVSSRAVMIATGVAYRRLEIPALDRLVGMGVFYGAAATEAAALAGEPVVVIGGANSAGQAALQLAKHASRVTILVRGASLEASMSEYLLREIATTPNIDVRTETRVVDGHGELHLASLTVEHVVTGARDVIPACGAFVMIGASPRTDWLDGNVDRGLGGYLRTGDDISPRAWPLSRAPYSLETSMPGVFAIGDVRSNAVKRVVSAVGDGGVAVGQVHRYLATTPAAPAPRPVPNGHPVHALA